MESLSRASSKSANERGAHTSASGVADGSERDFEELGREIEGGNMGKGFDIFTTFF